MNHWWCMDCRSAVDLDTHGRCGSCESEAVDPFHPCQGQQAPGSMAEAAITNSVSCS